MIRNEVKRRLGRPGLIIFLNLLLVGTALAKNVDDVVVLKNGDRLTGEIKGLQRGELRIKSDYMAEAVRLDWAKVERLESKSTFMIWLVDGKLVTDVMRLLPTNSYEIPNFIIGSSDQTIRVPQLDVIRITPADRQFWKRLEGSIDFGFSFTSGNDQYQTQLAATATYRTGDHSFTGSIDSAFSGQTEGTSLTRNQFNFDYRKQLNERWYVGGLVGLLRSDQQSLRLRTSVGGLIGRNLKQTEHTRLSVYGGLVGTRENYSESIGTPRTTNADAIAGADFATFRFNSVDIRSRFSLFPSLTTPGRTRLQATSDLQIKIVKDLWWGFHVYENYDSKPPVRADKNDLGVSTSLGWKF
jgi:putative salt-induced outer membrane protein YdiY